MTGSGDGLAFALPGGGQVLFTARADGNMSSVGGEGHELGGQARERLRARLGLAGLVRGYQVHGARVMRVCRQEDLPPAPPAEAGADAEGRSGAEERSAKKRPAQECSMKERSAQGRSTKERSTKERSAQECSAQERPAPEADGQATCARGIGVMALAADCLPIAIGGEGAVAMVHAGWRGLAAGVLEEGVCALRDLAGDRELEAVIGPGAGPCCYEVGPEVRVALAQADIGGRGRIDLKAIARARLLATGVRRVTDVGLCTICDTRFYSHRREGARAGRQAGVAWLSP